MISEAYSTRYKNAIHSSVFDRAIKNYRARAHVSPLQIKSRQGLKPTPPLPPSSPNMGHSSSIMDSAVIDEHNKRLQEQLEALPRKILGHARTFRDHMEYFVGRGSLGVSGADVNSVPDTIKKLLDDITGAEKIGDRIKQEILQDSDSRQVCFIRACATKEKTNHILLQDTIYLERGA